MSNIKEFSKPTKNQINRINELIDEIKSQELDELFLIGVKDNKLYISYSGFESIEQKIGAIEMLKFELLRNA